MLQHSAAPTKIHHLPAQLTSFVGREQEIEEIRRQLTNETCRLLTLVGPGGSGKTRLAVQAAPRLADLFDDGIYFIPLQSLDSADQLATVIANALSLPLAGQATPQTQLVSYLQSQELLLVLDNLEHLLPDALDLLTRLLTGAPAIKVLVTSREALSVQEEWLRPIRGLTHPQSSLPEPDDMNESWEAVQLFADRARRVRSDFSLAAEQPHVMAICRLVDGMPLALELAATWAKSLPCHVIADELRRNLDFLSTQLRNVATRHRSMWVVFEQSWQRLSEPEQAVMMRLAIFRGGFQRAAAEKIAGATLSILTGLVDKSFVYWESDGRYQLHELLRQFAEERLTRSSAAVAEVRNNHCRYYTYFLQSRNAQLMGGQQRAAIAAVKAELDNIRTATEWALSQGQVDDIAASAPAFNLFYAFQGRYLEQLAYIERMLDLLVGDGVTMERTLARADLLNSLAWCCIRLGRLEQAAMVLDECQLLYRRLGSPPVPGYATDPQLASALIALIRGDYATAAELAEQARLTSEVEQNSWNRQSALYLLARAASERGQYEVAQQYAQQAYATTKQMSDEWFMAYCLNELGHIARALHDPVAARSYFENSYALRQEFDDPEGMAVALTNLGKITVQQGNFVEAERLFRQSLAIYERIGDRGGLATAYHGLGRIAAAYGDRATARYRYAQVLEIGAEIRYLPLLFALFLAVAELDWQTGNQTRALSLLSFVQLDPAADYEARARAQQLLTEYQAHHQTAAPPKGHEEWGADLERVVAKLQTELVASLPLPIEAPTPTSPPSQLPAHPLIEPLTGRELEVLYLIAQGYANQEIANHLIVAVGTVKAHTAQIYSKLSVHNRTHAVSRARELGLLPT